MLKTVKSFVDEPVVPFAEYYMKYVMQVQDQNIDMEIKQLVRLNKPTVFSMGKLIDYTYKSIKKE